MNKANGQAANMSFSGHALMETRNGQRLRRAIFNLGTLGRNDTSATPMSDLFRGGIP